MAYPAAADLKDASEVDALKALSDPDLDDVYAVAVRSVEEFCGQKFIQTVETRLLDGAGGRTVALPERLASLTSLSVSGSSLAATDVALNERHSELAVLAGAGGGNWVEQTLREDQLPRFTAGVGTISIDGVWGWSDAELPANDLTNNIARAIRMDMEDQALLRSGPLAETARTMARSRSNLLIEGPLRVSIDQTIIPLSPEVQTLLSDYVWQPVARVA